MDDAVSIFGFFDNIDLISGALQGTHGLEAVMGEALESVRCVFDADRAYLQYPCDPQADFWSLPVERTRADIPGMVEPSRFRAMDEEASEVMQKLLKSQDPVTFGGGNRHPLEGEAAAKNSIRSLMAMAVFPKTGGPWQIGIQQCSRERVWARKEITYFKEIGRRLAGALSLLLTLQELKEREATYSRIVNMANEGIWSLDALGGTSYVNARMAEILGYSTEEMLGRPVTYFMFDEDVADYSERLKNGFRGFDQPYERRYRHKNGDAVWVSVATTGIRDEAGNFIGGFGMVTDITEKKRAQEALLRLNEDLEAKVQSRTLELQASHAELEKAFSELKQAHASMLQQEKMASIGQLAAGIAHEINTPTQYVSNNISFLRESLDDLLGGVQGYREQVSGNRPEDSPDGCGRDLESMLKVIDFDYLKKEIPRALEESVEGVKRIAGIVIAMKEFAHPSGSKLEPVDLEKLIRTTVEISRNKWKHVAELQVEPIAEPLLVNGLRDELGQVLLNLVINAADAIAESRRQDEAPGRIGIQARVSGDWAEIVVEDTGCGIAPELQGKIFEPFFTTKEVGRGSGQGLAIAYHIVKDKHHGELHVDSSPGRGSRFTVRLPRCATT